MISFEKFDHVDQVYEELKVLNRKLDELFNRYNELKNNV